MVRSAVEVLGGNGAIEEFSVLPRLYRDAMVYESWEGSHNVLVVQVLNDLRRLPILEAVAAWLASLVGAVDDAGRATRLATELDGVLAAAQRCADDAEYGAWHFRDVVDRIGVLAEVALLAADGEDALSGHLLEFLLDTGARTGHDAGYPARVDAASAPWGGPRHGDGATGGDPLSSPVSARGPSPARCGRGRPRRPPR